MIGWTDGVTVIPWNELDEDSAAAISEIAETRDGIKVKMHDKVGALHKLGMQLGMFQAKQTGTAENPLHAFIQSMQGTALTIGHVQPVRPAPTEPAYPWTTVGQSPSAASTEPEETISPLLRRRAV